MTLVVTHQKVSAIADDAPSAAAGEVLPSDWNAEHALAGEVDSGQIDLTDDYTWTGQHQFNAGPQLAAPVELIQAGITTTTSTINALGTSSTGNITVASSTGFPASGYFWINSEIIGYTVVDGTTLNVNARGLFQSTAATHANGSTIAYVLMIAAASTASAPMFVMLSGSPTGQPANPVFIHPFGGALGNDSALVFRSGYIYDTGGSGLVIQGQTGTPVDIATAQTKRWRVDTSGHLVTHAATYDIGLSGGSRPRIVYSGTRVQAPTLQAEGVTFANLPGSPVAGMIATVTDSNTATWGATIAGGGANNVQARYNGANWTVMGA